MKYVALLDTETTGLDPKLGAQCIEVAVQLYDIEIGCGIVSYSELLGCDHNEAETVNRIPVAALFQGGNLAERVWERVRILTERAECFVAHRAEFDSQFVPADVVGARKWVCTKSDIKWPGNRRGDHLVQLALEMGLGVASAHRAMTDVDTMSRILTRAKEMGCDLQEMFRLALRPKVRVVAMVPFELNHLAKEAGFFWDAQRKQWYRQMAQEDMRELQFRAVVQP